MCSCVRLFACVHWTWPVSSLWQKPQAGVLYRGEGSLLMIQAQPVAPSFKRPPIIAPTYSQRRMSVNVDHTIHQLCWAQGPSNTGTADPQAASCLVYRLNPPLPQSSKLICCRRSCVGPQAPQNCLAYPSSGFASFHTWTPHLPVNVASCDEP